MPHAEVAHLGAHHPTKVRNSGLAPPVRRNYKFPALLATVLSQFLSKRYGVPNPGASKTVPEHRQDDDRDALQTPRAREAKGAHGQVGH